MAHHDREYVLELQRLRILSYTTYKSYATKHIPIEEFMPLPSDVQPEPVEKVSEDEKSRLRIVAQQRMAIFDKLKG